MIMFWDLRGCTGARRGRRDRGTMAGAGQYAAAFASASGRRTSSYSASSIAA